MHVKDAFRRLTGRGSPPPVIVREYGRDSLLVWMNLLLAPLFSLLGMRVGLQSEAQIAGRIEADSSAMRMKGYLVANVETFSLPVIGSSTATANWYRVTFERVAAPSRDEPHAEPEG